MKNGRYTLCLLLMAVLFSTACSSNDDNDNDRNPMDPEDFPWEDVYDMEIPIMTITFDAYDEDDIESSVMMYIEGADKDDVSLTINGNKVELEAYFGIFIAMDVGLLPEEEFSFELTIKEKTRSGTLTSPAILHAEFPESFNVSSDYTMKWTISRNPTLFGAWLVVESDEDFEDLMNVVDADKRSYTFSRNLYNDFSQDDLEFVEAGVSAITYVMIDDMLFMSESGDQTVYWMDDFAKSLAADNAWPEKLPQSRFINP